MSTATEVGKRPDIAAVILYGGEKVFAAGADIKEMANLSYADMIVRSVALQASFTAVAGIPKPVVAAVTGYALGGGCELALCADLRIFENSSHSIRNDEPELLRETISGFVGCKPGAEGG